MNIYWTPKCFLLSLAYCSTNLWDQRDGTSHDARLHRDIVGCVGRAFPRCGGLGCCLARMQDHINNSYAEEASPFSMRDARSDFWD